MAPQTPGVRSVPAQPGRSSKPHTAAPAEPWHPSITDRLLVSSGPATDRIVSGNPPAALIVPSSSSTPTPTGARDPSPRGNACRRLLSSTDPNHIPSETPTRIRGIFRTPTSPASRSRRAGPWNGHARNRGDTENARRRRECLEDKGRDARQQDGSRRTPFEQRKGSPRLRTRGLGVEAARPADDQSSDARAAIRRPTSSSPLVSTTPGLLQNSQGRSSEAEPPPFRSREKRWPAATRTSPAALPRHRVLSETPERSRGVRQRTPVSAQGSGGLPPIPRYTGSARSSSSSI